MQITSGGSSSAQLNFKINQAPKTDFNPPPKKEGIAPSRETIAAEAQATQATGSQGRKLDIFA